MKDEDHDKIWTEWRNLIGDFMMEFSEIEFISFNLWSKKYPGQTPSHNFKERTNQVISQLNGNKNAKVQALLKKSVDLADRRNTVAHNPTLMQVFQKTDSEELLFEYAISSFSQADYVNLEDMKELVAEVTDIKTSIYMELGYLPHEES